MFERPEPTYHQLRDEIERLKSEVDRLTRKHRSGARRERMHEMRDQARERWHEARGMAERRMHEADEYVHQKPWQVLGVAAIAALLLGVLTGAGTRHSKRCRRC